MTSASEVLSTPTAANCEPLHVTSARSKLSSGASCAFHVAPSWEARIVLSPTAMNRPPDHATPLSQPPGALRSDQVTPSGEVAMTARNEGSVPVAALAPKAMYPTATNW